MFTWSFFNLNIFIKIFWPNPGLFFVYWIHVYLSQEFITNRHLTHDYAKNGHKMTGSNFLAKIPWWKTSLALRFAPTAFWLALSCASCFFILGTEAAFCPTHMGPFKWPVLPGASPAKSGCQQVIWNTVQIFPEPVCLEREVVRLLDLQAHATEPSWSLHLYILALSWLP